MGTSVRCLRSSGLIQLRFRRRHRATPFRISMIPSLQLALTMKRMYCQTLHLKILRPALQLWVTISSLILTRRFQMTIAHHCNWQMSSVEINCTPLIEIFVCGTTVLEICACPESTTVLEPNDSHLHLH